MITDYIIIEKDSNAEMVEAVMKIIALGWEPLGGVNTVCIEASDGAIDTWYAQAMIKRSDEVKV